MADICPRNLGDSPLSAGLTVSPTLVPGVAGKCAVDKIILAV